MSLGLSLAFRPSQPHLVAFTGVGDQAEALAPHPNDPASPRIRRAGAMAITVKSTECWDIPALEELPVRRAPRGARRPRRGADCRRRPTADTRPVVLANGFTLSPHAETCSPGVSLKDGPAPFGTPVPTAQATDNSH
jgi:hypothetical protein